MVEKINQITMILFILCYAYQFVYIPIVWLKRQRPHGPERRNRIAVLIAARNEEAVLGNLIDSIKAQDYPSELVDIYVAADNCTDSTAAVARSHGAKVFERFDSVHVGKGYALSFLLGRIGGEDYDGYLVLDADNILSENYISELNKTFCDGYGIVTSYRNSKNYGDNWISAGYALWFLRESRYLNGARMLTGSSCAVSGTGFMFSREILEKCGGWSFFLLTEDIEFTIHNVLRGERIGFAGKAVLYDEQPVSFRQSWRQRLRWSRGYLQVFGKYGRELIKGIFRGSFSCYDMTMNIMPAAVLTAAGAFVNLGAAVRTFTVGGSWADLGVSVLQLLFSLYLTMFIIGAITTATEWKSIHCPAVKKLVYTFTFPVFMFTYVPICIASLFKNPQWKPIEHRRSVGLKEIVNR